MLEENPTVLFVHGAWHSPTHFSPIRALFEREGYPTCCPSLPSVGASPPVGLVEDAQRIREELTRLVGQEEKDVIALGHSYGGMVITQATDAEFSKRARQAKGKKGGVIYLLYICAFIPLEGQSVAEMLGNPSSMPSFVPMDEQGQYWIEEPAYRFYTDVCTEEQEVWLRELRGMSSTAMLTPATFSAYMHHPASYLFCEGDRAIPVELQREWVRKMEEMCGIKVRTTTCSAAHSPFLSQPEVLLKVVRNLAHDAYDARRQESKL